MSFNINRLKIYLRNHVLPAFLFQWRARFYKTPDAHLYKPMFHPWRVKNPFSYNTTEKFLLIH